MSPLSAHKELNYLRGLYFLFGFLTMSWIPRFPEVKAALSLTNGQFGSLISTGALGSFVALLTVGHVVHKYGVKVILQLAAFSISLCLIILSSTHSSLIFFCANLVFGASISAFHIAINSHAFDLQARLGRFIITQLNGIWSAGALITAIFAGLLVNRISLHLHITVLAILVFLIMLTLIQLLTGSLIAANDDPEMEYKLKDLFRSLNLDATIASGLICAIFLEFVIGDWATIYTNEEIGISGGLNTLPYILFTLAMIFGRLTVHFLLPRFSIEKLVKIASLTAGSAFLVTIVIARAIEDSHKGMALVIVSIGFTLAGLGSSFLGPTFMNAAITRSRHPASVVIGHIGVANIVLVFALKWIIAWTAQASSLTLAMLIPGLMLLAVPLFAKAAKHV